MYQIDNSTAAAAQPAATPAGTPGFFTDGNPASGVAATIVPAEWLNAMMMELANVVTGAGITLSKSTYNQVLSAIKRLGQATVVLADTGAVNAYTATNSPPLAAGTWVDGVVQYVKIAHANTGASTYAPDGLPAIPIYGLGLQPLQGGELSLNGTAILMHMTIAGVNSGNPIAVLMECAGGAQQVAPATQSNHAPQMAQVAGVVGSARNLAMSVTAASATATLTADEIIVETALGGTRYCLPSFSKTINLAATGAGGMDTGSAPTSGYVALYAVYNPTTGTSALLAKNATSAAQPNVYGGANMPAGYTASALVAVVPTNAGAQFSIGILTDRRWQMPFVTAATTTSIIAAYTGVSIASAVPPNAKSASGFTNAQNGSGASQTMVIRVAATASGIGETYNQVTVPSGQVVQSYPPILLVEQQKLYWRADGPGSPNAWTLYISGYDF